MKNSEHMKKISKEGNNMKRYKVIYYAIKPNGERSTGTKAIQIESSNLQEAIEFANWLNACKTTHDCVAIWSVSPEPQLEKWMISWIPAARRNKHTDTWHISKQPTHTNTTAGA